MLTLLRRRARLCPPLPEPPAEDLLLVLELPDEELAVLSRLVRAEIRRITTGRPLFAVPDDPDAELDHLGSLARRMRQARGHR